MLMTEVYMCIPRIGELFVREQQIGFDSTLLSHVFSIAVLLVIYHKE
jgi:hypothetical protein